MKYEIKQLNATEAVVISDEEIKPNTKTFKEGFNGDWFWNSKHNQISNIGDITSFDFKIIATIAPFKLEGLPMLELPNQGKYIIEYQQYPDGTHVCIAYNNGDWFCDCGIEGNEISENNARIILNSLNSQLPNQEEDVSKIATDYVNSEEISAKKKWNTKQYFDYDLRGIDLKGKDEFLYKKLLLKILSETSFGFQAGYKAAQSKKYSEEDLINFKNFWLKKDIEWFDNTNEGDIYKDKKGNKISDKDLINDYLQSLQKKQFPIAVDLEMECCGIIANAVDCCKNYNYKFIKWYYE